MHGGAPTTYRCKLNNEVNHHPVPYTVFGHRKLKVKDGEDEEAHLYAGHAKVLTLPVVV